MWYSTFLGHSESEVKEVALKSPKMADAFQLHAVMY